MRAVHFAALLLSVVAPVTAWVPNLMRHRTLLSTTRASARGHLLFADKSGGDGAGGGPPDQKRKKGAGIQTITIDKTDIETETELKEDIEDEGWWRVLLHNDEVHTFEYVVEAVVKVVPQITRKKAFVIARTVHMTGVGTITTVWKSLAEQLCMGLQTFGLTVSIANDKKFQDKNVRPDKE